MPVFEFDSELIFCLLNLSIFDREVLQSPTIKWIHLFFLAALLDFAPCISVSSSPLDLIRKPTFKQIPTKRDFSIHSRWWGKGRGGQEMLSMLDVANIAISLEASLLLPFTVSLVLLVLVVYASCHTCPRSKLQWAHWAELQNLRLHQIHW